MTFESANFKTDEVQFSAKTLAKRKAILKHATKLFAKEGFYDCDVQVVADLAKVGKGTVYRNFGNKRELFLATSRHCLEQSRDFVERELGGEDVVRSLIEKAGFSGVLREIAILCARYYSKNSQAVEIMIQERATFRNSLFPTHLMFRAENEQGVVDMIQFGIELGEFSALQPAQVVDAYNDLIFGTITVGCLGGAKRKLVQRMEIAIDLFLKGLCRK